MNSLYLNNIEILTYPEQRDVILEGGLRQVAGADLAASLQPFNDWFEEPERLP